MSIEIVFVKCMLSWFYLNNIVYCNVIMTGTYFIIFLVTASLTSHHL